MVQDGCILPEWHGRQGTDTAGCCVPHTEHVQRAHCGGHPARPVQGLQGGQGSKLESCWRPGQAQGKICRALGPSPPPPKGTPTHAMNNAPCAMQSSVLSPLCLLLLHMYWLKSGTAVPAVAVKLHTVPPSTTLITGSSLRSPATPLQSPATPMTNSQQLPCNPHHLQ